VRTKLLYELGDATITDKLIEQQFTYDVDSFFQVNLPVFEVALRRMKQLCAAENVVDMYAGAGTIGLSIGTKPVLVELDPAAVAMARINVINTGNQAIVIEASTERALEYIPSEGSLVFDPPRAGLHPKVVERVLEQSPSQVIYLSCNPATHARDLALLQAHYKVTHFEVFNFFPRTPHIETLAVLEKR
jgi:23S rRNA (uracil1939-C5)-methyltransferase